MLDANLLDAALEKAHTMWAINVVAKRVIADLAAAANYAGDGWENYPEIGEHDWDAVVERVEELIKDAEPQPDTYKQAYDHLVSRADGTS